MKMHDSRATPPATPKMVPTVGAVPQSSRSRDAAPFQTMSMVRMPEVRA